MSDSLPIGETTVAMATTAVVEYSVHGTEGDYHVMRRFRREPDSPDVLVEEHKILLSELEA